MVIDGVLDTEHLEEESVVLYVEAMLLDKVHLLPKKICEHTINCEACSLRVIRLYKLMKAFSIDG